MRKLLRQIARVRMQSKGIRHINKRSTAYNPITKEITIIPSYFSTNWRKYC